MICDYSDNFQGTTLLALLTTNYLLPFSVSWLIQSLSVVPMLNTICYSVWTWSRLVTIHSKLTFSHYNFYHFPKFYCYVIKWYNEHWHPKRNFIWNWTLTMNLFCQLALRTPCESMRELNAWIVLSKFNTRHRLFYSLKSDSAFWPKEFFMLNQKLSLDQMKYECT
jgi:hypothetical protein